MTSLIGGPRFDGRLVSEKTARATMLDCLERLGSAGDDDDDRFDGLAEWIIDRLMSKSWGYSPQVKHAINALKGGHPSHYSYIRGLQMYHSYGIGISKENIRFAVQHWRVGVASGDPRGHSHVRLGLCYELGDGVKADKNKAIALYLEAKERGSVSALSYLGYCYSKGVGVPQNTAEALELYTMAHQRGYITASYNLSSFASAVHQPSCRLAYLIEAAARGHEAALKRLRNLRQADALAVVPFGFWSAEAHVHTWLTPGMKDVIRCLLMAKRRLTNPIGQLPRLVLQRIFFYTVCRPIHYFEPSVESMALAAASRENWRLYIRMRSLEKRNAVADNKIAKIEADLDEMKKLVAALMQK